MVGLDPGTRRCGVAVSDRERTMAFPRPALDAGDTLVAAVVALVDEESADEVVVGRPVSLDGRETESTRLSDALADELGAALDVPVRRVDERLTSVTANRALREAGHDGRSARQAVDSAAAVLLLEQFLAGGS